MVRRVGRQVDQLVELLGQAGQLLDEYGEERWSAWANRCRDALLGDDYSAVDVILKAYGGMGSFNDVTLSRRPTPLRSSLEVAMGPRRASEEEQVDDLALHELRDAIWKRARGLHEQLNR